jgi:hypothetical protein
LRITRDSEGLRVVQEFFFGAEPYGPAELTIQMKVYNRTAAPVQVRVERFFDADIDGTPENDRAVPTADSVAIVNGEQRYDDPNANRGMLLSAGILDKTHFSGWNIYDNLVSQFESDEIECRAEFTDLGEPTDAIGGLTYDVGVVPVGAVRTISFLYRRF